MLEYKLMRYCRYRLSENPKETFLSSALEGFSRLLEKILSILKSPKGNRIREQKIKPQRIEVAGRIEQQHIKPPERLPRPRKIQPEVLGRDGKIKRYKGSPFRKLNRFR
jgi:hypothetical protein